MMVMFQASARQWLLAALLVAAFVGCSEQKATVGTIAGQVTLKGKPFVDGYLGLHNPTTKLNRSTRLDDEGNYLFSDIVPGDYVVLVVPRALDDEEAVRRIPIPKKLKRKETTDLSATVTAGEETKLDIELSK